MDQICPILWIWVKIGYAQLSLTFFHYYRPIWPIYHTCKRIIFPKKSMIFRLKICYRGAKSVSMGIARQSRVRINIPYKLTNLIFGFWNIKFLLTFCLTTSSQAIKQKVSKNFMLQNPKIKFVGLQGMLMRTRD